MLVRQVHTHQVLFRVHQAVTQEAHLLVHHLSRVQVHLDQVHHKVQAVFHHLVYLLSHVMYFQVMISQEQMGMLQMFIDGKMFK